MPKTAGGPIARQVNPSPPTASDFPLLTYADGLMDALRRHVPRALGEWDPEAIHQARVATRRMKAVLDLMSPVLSKKRHRPLARVLRTLRRRLGPLRDADVMIEHLQELATSHRCAAAATWLAEDVDRRRASLREASGRDVPSAEVLERFEAWGAVRDEIGRAAEAAGPLLADSVHRQLRDFADQADRLATPDVSQLAGQPQNPHELRIAGKALRYTLEMALVQGHKVPKRVMGTFKQMQELLGAWHDFVVLTDQAMRSSLDEQLAHHDAARQEQVLDLARFTARRSAQHLDAFRRLWSGKGRELADAIRSAVPLATGDTAEPVPPLSESQTGPGPNGSAAPAGSATSPPASPSAAS